MSNVEDSSLLSPYSLCHGGRGQIRNPQEGIVWEIPGDPSGGCWGGLSREQPMQSPEEDRAGSVRGLQTRLERLGLGEKGGHQRESKWVQSQGDWVLFQE